MIKPPSFPPSYNSPTDNSVALKLLLVLDSKIAFHPSTTSDDACESSSLAGATTMSMTLVNVEDVDASCATSFIMDTNDDVDDDDEDASPSVVGGESWTIHEVAPSNSSWVGNTEDDDEDDDFNGSMTNLSNNPPYLASLLIAPFLANATSSLCTNARIVPKFILGSTL